ncbi:MAG TPA: hypothetical protein V6C95_06460 [Coleofasciculaceae cyanobacterium]
MKPVGERLRLRIDPDLEQYILSQSERILGKTVETSQDKSLLLNRIVYEHKLLSHQFQGNTKIEQKTP